MSGRISRRTWVGGGLVGSCMRVHCRQDYACMRAGAGPLIGWGALLRFQQALFEGALASPLGQAGGPSPCNSHNFERMGDRMMTSRSMEGSP